MKILVITYGNSYSGFIQTRNLSYVKKGHKVAVFAPNTEYVNIKKDNIYFFSAGKEGFKREFNKFKPDVVFFHFLLRNRKDFSQIIFDSNVPVITFVHGTEAISWWRYYYLFTLAAPFKFLFFIQSNIRQLLYYKEIVRFANQRTDFGYIFVSNWMKLIAERDIGVKFKNFEIIANSIDFDIFKYKKKCAEKRLNIVSIRSLANKKYATDKLLKIILELSKREYFEELRIELFFHSATTRYGKTMLDKFKQISNKYKNITITNTFLSPTEMNKIYLNNGIFLGTTRKDAQGVVMCEATSCGLVPIVSNNTAIPEFINKEFGFLCKKTTDFVQAIDFLYNNPSEYLRMSELSAKSMLKYNAEEMINKEIDFAQRLIKNSGK